ncbi:HupE/UreJ family protein [Aliiroseovarius lamellibrachiae]|uniref:HupE/UreJ family protein n=1 Tax=Aliiroseovarius lamellibrachiae TaxID=1924933 RepID=UPI001BDF7965|nr:HupE/UreJ family protein [Aliiroseovarius lamellibrachiae]MBT2132228.1 HupE/UreJ family protein [Aliiroseovarius lamellibrachiae]
MKRIFLTLMATLAASPALAHLNPDEHGSFMAGLSHPVFGLDHILAMIAVGLWAASLGGRAIWALPSAFVAAMVLGFGVAVAGVLLPFVEPIILLSVFALGLTVAFAIRLPATAAASIVAVFGLFHGFAHGGELGSAGAVAFGAGFALAAAILHAFGISIAVITGQSLSNSKLMRSLGWATAFGGLWIASGG